MIIDPKRRYEPENLVRQYLPRARALGQRQAQVHRQDREEMISVAFVGLWQAARVYNGRGEFWPYARQTITGEILSEVQKLEGVVA